MDNTDIGNKAYKFYKKELTFNKVTNALFMFVEKQGCAVQPGLMAVSALPLNSYKKTRNLEGAGGLRALSALDFK